jgi:hypothetical protein
VTAAQLDAALHAQAYHDFLVEHGVGVEEAVEHALGFMKEYGNDEFLYRRGITQVHPGDSDAFKHEAYAEKNGHLTTAEQDG